MTEQDGMNRLIPALISTGSRQYCFCCRNAIVLVRFRDSRATKCFSAADQVSFRIDESGIAVTDLRTGALRELLLWQEIETLTAGEPETSNGLLFQG